VVGGLEDLGRDVSLEDHALDGAGPVPELEEVELPGGATVVKPPVKGDLLPQVLRDLGDVDGREHAAAPEEA
jgi:hypothetical protein